ncbi:MAG: hypothetical protein JWM91_2043 [Rhodospirillales bacterium]|nr:hypothetical protein [Rhodospirillales bacterium]
MGEFNDPPLPILQTVPGSGELQRFARAIMAPAAAIAGGAERGQLDYGVHPLQEFAVVTNDDGTAPIFGKEADHRRAPLPVEIIGRLIQSEEIGLRDDEDGEPGARALAAGQDGEAGLEPCVQPEAAEGRTDARLERPVGGGEVLAVACPASARPSTASALATPNRSAIVSSGSG